MAFNRGNGATSVTATGAVVGASSNGIDIGNRATGTNLIVNAASVSGGGTGILAANIGTGTTSISASGIVQGGTSAISASANNQAVDLQFAATSQVRNASLSPTALAVVASGSSVSLGNAGRLTGAVQLTGANNLMTSTGTWSTAGATNTLGGPTGQLVNTTTGVILAGQSAGAAETRSSRAPAPSPIAAR